MIIVSKAARIAVTFGFVALLGGCAGQQVAQPYDPYRQPVAVAEPVPAPSPRVIYAPSPFYGPDYAYYDDGYHDGFAYRPRSSLAVTVFGGGSVLRDRRSRDDRRRGRNRDAGRTEANREQRREARDDRRGQNRAERREARDDRRGTRRGEVVPATNREEGRRADRRPGIAPLTAEERRLRRRLWRERRAALREARGREGGGARPERGNGEGGGRRRGRGDAAD